MIGNFINIVLPVAGLLGFSTSSFVHYAVDAVLVSVCLSGIKRSTGLSPAVSKIQNKEIRQVVVSYLDVGGQSCPPRFLFPHPLIRFSPSDLDSHSSFHHVRVAIEWIMDFRNRLLG
ncbi:hypothetical protein PGTUg99_004248 [Puccinia graminis f. sp. tritici]|uniref:Uncharacterized protein n=1 Tax=Puccinia graminis f. sp. tritici TaxID=56615 RepID=A0A5B0RD32_PUCGR|nr:hypothetical protein PGTUg99_004248 [Puccinia graminis f. sp. tritici]